MTSRRTQFCGLLSTATPGFRVIGSCRHRLLDADLLRPDRSVRLCVSLLKHGSYRILLFFVFVVVVVIVVVVLHRIPRSLTSIRVTSPGGKRRVSCL